MSYEAVGRAVLSRRDQQRTIASAHATTRYVATGAQTEQNFGLYEYVLKAGAPGAAAHYHPDFRYA